MKKAINTGCKQAGISLLEVMLSLSIIAIILVMATRYYFLASNAQRVNQTRQQIATIIAGVQLWKESSSATYAGLGANGIQTLIDAGDLVKTADYDSSTGNLFNPWARPVTLTATSSGQSATIATTVGNMSQCNDLKSSYPTGVCLGTNFSLDIYGQSTP